LVSYGIIIYDTHFAVASACNALNNGWSKGSRCERYTAGSVIRRDRLTARESVLPCYRRCLKPYQAERNTGFHRITFTPSLNPFGIER
jgi:hypothetical protein